ncbi:MAG: hypothetical protein IPQ15_16695 [Betaproteobacteria bacterium]|nr:hypothetical protein [Betaproteobacteria bacterium]
MERWTAEGLSPGTVKNRMTELRWWAEKIGKPNVVAKSNDVYGIPDRRYVTNVSKARPLTAGDLAQVADPYPGYPPPTAGGVYLVAKSRSRSSWPGRTVATGLCPRQLGPKAVMPGEIPIRHVEQRQVLDERRVAGRGSLIPADRVAAAAALLRVPVRSGRHPPGPWSPPPVRPGAPLSNWLVEVTPADPAREPTRAEEHRSRGTADHQSRARA